MSVFCRYLNNPTSQTYYIFKSGAKKYYKQYPHKCLKLLERNGNNWVFRVVFSLSLVENMSLVNPTAITRDCLSYMLRWISLEVKSTFECCCHSYGEAYKTNLETLSMLINLAERTIFELRALGINDALISEISDPISIWKFLVKNISIDFVNKTIEYYSLFRMLSEINFIIDKSPHSNSPNLQLSKRLALLYVYLRYIYLNLYDDIFDLPHHHHRTSVIYLVMEFWGLRGHYSNGFYPERLMLQIENLNKSGSPRLNLFENIFEKVQTWTIFLFVKRSKENYEFFCVGPFPN